MKKILIIASLAIGFAAWTSNARAQDDGANDSSSEQQQTKSLGEGAKSEKPTKAERKAMKTEKKKMHKMKKMKKEMQDEAAEDHDSDDAPPAVEHKNSKHPKKEKAKPAAKVKKAEESPGMPTDEQIKKSDAEDDMGGGDNPE